jgi:hypothetical protein
VEIRTEIDIDAPPDRVWSLLTDTERFPSWNPLMVRASGKLARGERPHITVRAGRTMEVRPEVLVADAPRELRWRGELVTGWLFAGEHYFRIEPRGEGVRFVHGELFSGLLVPLLARTLRRDAPPAFEAMNRALKARAEATADLPPAA